MANAFSCLCSCFYRAARGRDLFRALFENDRRYGRASGLHEISCPVGVQTIAWSPPRRDDRRKMRLGRSWEVQLVLYRMRVRSGGVLNTNSASRADAIVFERYLSLEGQVACRTFPNLRRCASFEAPLALIRINLLRSKERLTHRRSLLTVPLERDNDFFTFSIYHQWGSARAGDRQADLLATL